MIKFLANPRIFVFTIIWMMVLVFIGTIAQRDIGLYLAQQKYFSSLLLWLEIGGVQVLPLPGGLLTMIILFVNLLAFFFKPNIWTKNKLGVLIIHGGALVLLLGGGITAGFSNEGRMVITEGQSSDYIESWHEKEFSISIDYGEETDSLEIINFSEEFLKKNEVLQHHKLPFQIKVIDYFINSEYSEISPSQVINSKKEFTKISDLKKLPDELEYEQNASGIKYQIISEQPDIAGTYMSHILEREEIKTILTIDGQTYVLSLRLKRTYLPFQIELKKFKHVEYYQTTKPKSFSSEVMLNTEGASKRFLIEMNAPLRYDGYTLYQASYSGEQTSVLAVVKNYGALFPYIASIIMCIGVLIQMLFRLPKLMKRKND